MKKIIFTVIIISVTLILILGAFLIAYPHIEIDTGSKLIKCSYDEDFSEYDVNHSYNELYCYNEKYDVSIRSFDVKKFLFFYTIHMEYIPGDFRKTQFSLNESYIEKFINEAKIIENENNIQLASLIEGKTAVVGNTRYLNNDYNNAIYYELDGKYEEMYVFYDDDLLVIQVGSPDELPKYIAYKQSKKGESNVKNNAIIFGDSYSTFRGFNPNNYATYYCEDESSQTDVRKVSQTWWHQVCERADLNLVLNDSWAGSTIGYTGYDNVDCSTTSSFIYRLKKLKDQGFFTKNEISTVFVFGGTNDSWSNAPLGKAKYSDWEKEDLYFVLPSICYFLNYLKETLPQAEIYCVINTELKPEIISCMKSACKEYNVTPVSFNTIDKTEGHPTVQGMKEIANGVLIAMNK